MSEHQLGNPLNITDKRQSYTEGNNSSHLVSQTVFTANAAGTTTTIVGPDPASGEGPRINDGFKLYSGGVPKEDTVFTVTASSSDGVGATTITFDPAASVATGSGDEVKLISVNNYQDNRSLDARLRALGFSDSDISLMNKNDKVYAIRLADDPGGF